MQNEPAQPGARTKEARESSALAARLLRRQAEPLGLIDVKHAALHYERLTRWLAERFPLLGYLQSRYADAHESSPDGQTFLMRQWGEQADSPSNLSRQPSQADQLSNLSSNLSTNLSASSLPTPPSQAGAKTSGAWPEDAPASRPTQKLRVSRHSARRAARVSEERAAAAHPPPASRPTDSPSKAASDTERGEPYEKTSDVARENEVAREVEIPRAARQPLTESPSPLPLAGRKAAEGKTAEGKTSEETSADKTVEVKTTEVRPHGGTASVATERHAASDSALPFREAVRSHDSDVPAAAADTHSSGTTTGPTPADKVMPVARADVRVAAGDSAMPLREAVRPHESVVPAVAAASHASHPGGTPTATPAEKVMPDVRADVRVKEATPVVQPSTLPLAEKRSAAEHAEARAEVAARAASQSDSATVSQSDPAMASRADAAAALQTVREAEMPLALPTVGQEAPPLAFTARPAEVGGRKNPVPLSLEVRDDVPGMPQPPELVWSKRGGKTAGDDFRPGVRADETFLAARQGESLAARQGESLAARQGESSGPQPASPRERQTVVPATQARSHEAEIDIGRLTERVMRAISRRLSVERERRGLRP